MIDETDIVGAVGRIKGLIKYTAFQNIFNQTKVTPKYASPSNRSWRYTSL